MFKIFGEYYYIDMDAIDKFTTIINSSGTSENQVHLVKYDTIKLMIEIVMDEIEEIDEKLGKNSNELSVPFKLAFNTLLSKSIINKL